jgi:hypothetical protein
VGIKKENGRKKKYIMRKQRKKGTKEIKQNRKEGRKERKKVGRFQS